MTNNRAFVVGSIFGGIVATIVVGNVLSHSRMLSTCKQETINAMSTDMSEDIYKAIVCIVQM